MKYDNNKFIIASRAYFQHKLPIKGGGGSNYKMVKQKILGVGKRNS